MSQQTSVPRDYPPRAPAATCVLDCRGTGWFATQFLDSFRVFLELRRPELDLTIKLSSLAVWQAYIAN